MYSFKIEFEKDTNMPALMSMADEMALVHSFIAAQKVRSLLGGRLALILETHEEGTPETTRFLVHNVVRAHVFCSQKLSLQDVRGQVLYLQPKPGKRAA